MTNPNPTNHEITRSSDHQIPPSGKSPDHQITRSPDSYQIDALAKEESWRLFRIIGEFVEGFDALPRVLPAVTIYGSARAKPGSWSYEIASQLAAAVARRGFTVITGGGPG